MRDTKTIPGVKNEPGIVQCDLRDAAFLNANVSFHLNTGRTHVNTWVVILVHTLSICVVVNQQCFYSSSEGLRRSTKL